MPDGPVRHCRVCDGTQLELVIDLGTQPWCNDFLRPEEVGHEPLYPLRVVQCGACATAQLDYTVPKEVMFGEHTYLSGTTRTLGEHFRTVAEEVDRRFCAGLAHKAVLDIGSNDGTQLKQYQSLGFDVLGVESAATPAALATAAGVPTLKAFFNLDVARELGRRFQVINASGVFFHLDELHSVTEGIREALDDRGVFVVQFLYMKQIMRNVAFDQIYHEHLLYYTLATIETLLNRHGLALFDAYVSPIHGGSVIGFVGRTGDRPATARLENLRRLEAEGGFNTRDRYLTFAQEIETLKRRDVGFLEQAKANGERVFGLGAPAKGNTLLNHFRIGPDIMPFLVEKNSLRKGLFSPGMHIPIILEEEVEQPPDVYYVLAWNFRKEILANNVGLAQRGTHFYFPIVPEDDGA